MDGRVDSEAESSSQAALVMGGGRGGTASPQVENLRESGGGRKVEKSAETTTFDL